jgi:hypothetical protein
METAIQNEEGVVEQPRDKKKIVIVAILVVAILGVGAFQFTQSSGTEAKSGAKSKKSVSKKDLVAVNDAAESPEDALKRQVIDRMVSGTLPRRDPFRPMESALPPETKQEQETSARPKLPPTPKSAGGAGRMVDRIVPPFDPGVEGPLPPAGGIGKGDVKISEGKPLRQPNEFAYTLTGVIVGERPMCVFQNDAGNQFLVPVGGSLDPESKVTKISRGEVKVRHRGKDLTLKIGGQ